MSLEPRYCEPCAGLWSPLQGCWDSCVPVRASRNIELGSELGSLDVRTLANQGDDFEPSCAPSTGPDVAYWWTAPVPGEYEFTATGAMFSGVTIQLLDGCDSELRCGEPLLNPWSASLRHDLDQGESVIIVVDGKNGEDEMYELTVALVTE